MSLFFPSCVLGLLFFFFSSFQLLDVPIGNQLFEINVCGQINPVDTLKKTGRYAVSLGYNCSLCEDWRPGAVDVLRDVKQAFCKIHR